MQTVKNMSVWPWRQKLYGALILSCVISCLFWALRVVATGVKDYWYLIPNLLLGVIPLLFVWLLQKSHNKKGPKTGGRRSEDWTLFGLWLLFVPNSFYLLTDFIHLSENVYATPAPGGQLFDVVMLGAFMLNGFFIGYLTLLYMHRVLAKRFGKTRSHQAVFVVLLAISFAIYLGRDLRLNSWDVIARPFDLLFGLGEPFFNPHLWLPALGNTFMYFMLIAPFYLIAYILAEASDTMK